MLDDFKDNIAAATVKEPSSAASDDFNLAAIPSPAEPIADFALSLPPFGAAPSFDPVHLADMPQIAPTISWAVNASGNWGTTVDWSSDRLPGSGDDVLISTRNSQTITFTTGNSTIHSLTVGDDTFAMSGGALTITDGASFSHEFTIGGATLATGGTTTIPDQSYYTAAQLQNSAIWKNTGTVNDGGQVSFSSTSAIGNEKGAAFDLTSDDAGMNGGSGNIFKNMGTLAKTGGADTSVVAVVLDNTGTVSASSGTLDFTAGGSLAGIFSTSNGAVIELGGGSFATVTASAKLGGAIIVSGATLSPATGDTMTLSGTDTFGGNNGEATLAGAGTIVTSGTTTIVDHDYYTSAQLNDAMWHNTGKVYDGGQVSLSSSSTIENLASGVFNLTADDGAVSGGSSNTFDNAGTLAKTGGGGTSMIAAILDNTGTVKASSGILDFTDGGSLGGTFATSNAAAIELGGGTFGAVSSTVTLGGDILVSGATLLPTIDITITLSGTDTFGGGNGEATLAGAGIVATSGKTTVLDQSYYTAAQLNEATWQNSGTVTDAGVISLSSTSFIDNQAAGIFNLTTDDATLGGGAGNTFNNAGTLAKTGGTETSVVAAILNNTGTVRASSGILDFTDGGSLGGTFATSNAATIELGGGTFGTVFAAATVAGNILVSGAALSPTIGSTMTLSGTDTFGGGNGGVTLGGGGIVATSGTTTIIDHDYYTVAQLNGATWQNSGTVNDGVVVSLSSAATIDNTANGIFNLTSDDGSISGGSGNTFNNAGTFAKTGGVGFSNVDATFDNTGTINASSGTIDFHDAVGGTGTAQADAYAGLEFDSSATSSLKMVFNGGNATLDLLNPSSFAAVISGFATSDTIDLLGITATKAALKSGDVLQINDNTTVVATLQLSGTYVGDLFTVKSDGNGGTDIITNAPAASVITVETAGGQDVYFEQGGQMFTSTGASSNISILAGTSHDAFHFDGAFGHVAIAGFAPGANTLVFDHNDFANTAALEAHAVQDAQGDTVITLDAHDTIMLRDVSLAAFETHASDWHFM